MAAIAFSRRMWRQNGAKIQKLTGGGARFEDERGLFCLGCSGRTRGAAGGALRALDCPRSRASIELLFFNSAREMGDSARVRRLAREEALLAADPPFGVFCERDGDRVDVFVARRHSAEWNTRRERNKREGGRGGRGGGRGGREGEEGAEQEGGRERT